MRWIIKNGDGLYWSNEMGWVSKSIATHFTQSEVGRFNLPVGKKVRWVSAKGR